MGWHSIEQMVVPQAITAIETTAKVPLGKIIKAEHETYGEGEFIYLQGVAGTGIGDIVEYNTGYQTGKASTAVTEARPVAVAMAACTASYYGWYQISGQALVSTASATTFAADAAFAASSGEAVAAATGVFIHGGAVVSATNASNYLTQALVMISRPHGPGET